MGKMLVDEAEQLLGVVIELFLRGRIESGHPGIVGVNGESATRLAVDVHVDTTAHTIEIREICHPGSRFSELNSFLRRCSDRCSPLVGAEAQ